MVTMKKSVTMEAVKSLLLEWDGDGSGLEAVETAGGTLYKVADVIVQNEDIPGMTVTDNEGKETLVTDSIYNDMISRSLVGDGFSAKVAGLVWIAQKEAQAPGAKLPAGGIWLLKKQDGSYPKKVVLPAYREAFLQGEKPNGEQGESSGGGSVNSVNGVKPDGAGNVALKYDDLTDKPFYEESVTGSLEITTADIDPDSAVTDSTGQFFKLADITPTKEEVLVATVSMGGQSYPVSALGDTVELEGAAVYADGMLFVVTQTGAEVDFGDGTVFAFPEIGMYAYGQVYGASISFPSVTYQTVKKLDNKYLDLAWLPTAKKEFTAIASVEATTAANGTIGGESDEWAVNAYAAGKTLTVEFNGEIYTCTGTETEFAGWPAYVYGNESLVSASVGDITADSSEPFAILLCKLSGAIMAMWLVDTSNGVTLESLSIMEEAVVYNKIPEAFLPEESTVYALTGTASDDVTAIVEIKKALNAGKTPTCTYDSVTYRVIDAINEADGYHSLLLARVHDTVSVPGIFTIGFLRYTTTGATFTWEMGQNYLVMGSSTSASTKRFKITVDDSGTLTATEVTA